MAVRDVLKMGDARLLRIAPPVEVFGTIELKKLVIDLFETMHATQGIGIAAPQIGVNLQVVVFGLNNDEENERLDVPRTVLLNPVIAPLSNEVDEAWEGCLSVPGLRGLVPRYTHIRYQGVDAQGAPIDREAHGFHARVVQHECDHLIGRLYPTRIKDMTQFGFVDAFSQEEDEEDLDALAT